MFCKQCGAELGEGATFCGKCGASQTEGEKKRTVSDRYETKVIQVHPDFEDDAIKKYELFGWECAQSQTVKTKDSHLEKGFGDSIVSVTETETFIKLTFKRRLNMPNYDRLKELEEKYDNATDLDDPPKRRKWPYYVGGFLIIFGILYIVDAALNNITGAVCIGIGVALIFYALKCRKTYMEKQAAWQKAHDEAEMTKCNCEEEARRLL